MKYLNTASSLLAIITVFIITISFSSCIKDDFEFDKLTTTQWNPSLAIPIVNSALKLEDFVPEDDHLIVGPNNEIVLIYESLYESPFASEIYKIPNQNFDQRVDFPGLPPGASVDTGSIVIDTTMILDFNAPTAMEMDSIFFKSGQWNFNFSSSFRQSGTLQIIIKDAQRNNISFINTIPFNYTGTVPVTTSASFGLGNYWFDLSRQGLTYNQIEVRYILTLINNGNTYDSTNAFDINQTISNINFNQIHGYFGEQSISANLDTIDFSIFQNEFQYTSLSLTNPSLTLDISNSFGMPIEAQLNQFSGYSDQNGYTPINGPGLPNPIYVTGPALSQMGQSILTSINLDKTNSNLQTVLNSKPDAFLYNSNSLTNPDGRAGKNFIEETSRLTVNTTFELPLEGMFDKLVFSDTMDFSLDGIEEIESITLMSNMDNGFPMDFSFQFYFMDDNNIIIDSLQNQSIIIIESAKVNPTTGLVIEKVSKHSEIIIPQDKVQTIQSASKIVMRASSTSFSNGTVSVKIKANYELDVKLGAIVSLKMNL